MNHAIYISYVPDDLTIAEKLVEGLEQNELECWIAPRDVSPGSAWGDAIALAIIQSKAFILILSSNSNLSQRIRIEVELAVSKNIPIIIYSFEQVEVSETLSYHLESQQWFYGSIDTLSSQMEKLVVTLRSLIPQESLPKLSQLEKKVRREESKGYVFISYVKTDIDFVENLRNVLKSKHYGYWDYVVGNRNYHGLLYRELEERIDGAVAFMTIVSDGWRESDWVASEFIYAREAKIPIFVIQAKKLLHPFPILINLQTRIDMSEDFDRGVSILLEELSKKGL